MFRAEIGILGGSGLYHMPGLTNVRQEQISTPFGEPSDWLTFGELRGRKVVFLARHGRGHHLLPSDINYRANIYAMKQAGVSAILSISAVGSLKEEHKPGKFVVPDQFIDRTYARRSTFFGPDIVAHVALADPVCAEVGNAMMAGCASSRGRSHTRRNLCVHGRAAVFYQGGIEPVSIVGRGRDRHDEFAGGQAVARSGDLLRHGGHGDGLRLLASGT